MPTRRKQPGAKKAAAKKPRTPAPRAAPRKIAVKAFDEPRPYEIPRSLMTTDWQEVVNDPQVHVVIELVGGTGLHRVQPAHHEAEIGYWIRAPLRQRGLCTEAVAGLLTWAFTPQARGGWGFRRVHIRCAGANAASARVPGKLNLPFEARHAQERWVTGVGWQDTLVWGVLAEQWDLATSSLRAPPAPR